MATVQLATFRTNLYLCQARLDFCTTKGVDCEDVKVHHHFLIVVYQCVETHLGGEGKHSHVDSHTPTPHAEI